MFLYIIFFMGIGNQYQYLIVIKFANILITDTDYYFTDWLHL